MALVSLPSGGVLAQVTAGPAPASNAIEKAWSDLDSVDAPTRDEARKKIEVMEREREELRECLDSSRRFAIIHGKLQRKEATEAAEAQLSALKAENADLKTTVIAFCAPWAVEYAKDHGLDGLHPTHYDILEKCGARMVDFDRASLVVPSVGKTP